MNRSQVNVIAPSKSKFPDPRKFVGIILTGSHAMITDAEDWSKRTARWILEIIDKQVPLLGICYGHQLIASALGGTVADNPNGKEFGTVKLFLKKNARKNLLFKNTPWEFFVHVSHTQSVLSLPPQAEILAFSDKDQRQAFFVPPCTWGVQFHPEFSAEISRAYVKYFADQSRTEGQDVGLIYGEIRETMFGKKILKNFIACAEEEGQKLSMVSAVAD